MKCHRYSDFNFQNCGHRNETVPMVMMWLWKCCRGDDYVAMVPSGWEHCCGDKSRHLPWWYSNSHNVALVLFIEWSNCCYHGYKSVTMVTVVRWKQWVTTRHSYVVCSTQLKLSSPTRFCIFNLNLTYVSSSDMLHNLRLAVCHTNQAHVDNHSQNWRRCGPPG